MALSKASRQTLLITLGLLALAGIDIASNARPVAWSDGALALAGAIPVIALALVAFVPNRSVG